MARESQIQIHRTEAVGATPSGLTSGELAVNLTDQKLFVGLPSGGYLTFNSVVSSPYSIVSGGNGIVVGTAVAGTANTYTVSLNRDITGNTLNITGNAIFSGSDSGVTFSGRVSIGSGSGAWGLYKNPDEYNLTPSSVAGTFDFTKTIAASIDYANRIGGKVAELVPANAFNSGTKNVIDIDSITGAGVFLAKSYSVEQGAAIGQYLGTVGSLPPLFYKNAPGDPPQTNTVGNVERALLVENINTNFQALGLVNTQIGTPFRTLIQYGTWIDNIQSPSGLGGAPAASGTYETTFDKYVRTGYLLRGGAGTSGGATGTYVWSQWKNLVETVDDLGKYGVSTVNGGTGDISITGAGNDAAVSVRSTVAGTHLIDARMASGTVTGVASFHPGHFTVSNGRVVASFSGGVTFSGTVSGAVKSVNGNDGIVTITGAGNDAAVSVRSTVAGTHLIDARMASLTVTGVASFDRRHFAIGASGHVSLTGTYQVTGDTVVAGNSISVSRSNNQATITNTGVTGIGFGVDTGLTGKINLTGAGATSSQRITVSGNTVTLDNRIASTSVTGVASFNSAEFTVSPVGAVSLSTGNTFEVNTTNANKFNVALGGKLSITASGAILSIVSSPSEGNATVTLDNRVATSSLTGVASFHPGHFTVTNGNVVASFSGGVTFNGTVSGVVKSVNGNDGIVTITGAGNDAAVSVRSTVAGTHLIDARMASLTVTGVASFDRRHFAIGASGHVSLTGTYQVTGDTVVAGNSISVIRSNNQATITNTGVTGIAFSVDGGGLGLTGRITLTGSAITVLGNTITFTSGSGGVPSVNGNATAITITGAGNDAAVSVRSSVAGTHLIDARIATSSLTGVASFHPGHFTVTDGRVVASFSGGVTFGGTVSGAVKSFNGNGGVVTITGAGQGNGQAIKVTSTVAGTHLIDARLASYTLTGVAYFDPNAFIVDEKGYIQLNGGGGGPCSDYTSQGTCVSNDCVWCDGIQECVQEFCSGPLFTPNGIGASANANGSLAYLYFDPASLTAYTGTYTSKKTNYVLIYDGDETGLVKAKRASLENFFSENSSLIKSSTTGQLSNAVKKDNGLGTSTIELGVVLGNVAAGEEGLVKGASAYAYIETNTVRSFNGLTGSVTAVGSVNGCTAAVVITGSASEIEVLNTCPNIVIGLPDNVTISNLNVLSGATFGGNISAKNVVTSFNGATGAVLADAVTWSVITADQTAVINRGYFANKGTLLTLTLPTTAAVGSVLRVSGMNAGLWRIAQNASEVIHFGKTDTTVGTSGYLESTLARDSVELICCVADNEWNVVSSIGNITIA